MNYLYGYSCSDCKYFKNRELNQFVLIDGKYCLKDTICEPLLRKCWKENFDSLKYEFVCDFFRRNNSGAYRRKLKKKLKNH